MEITFVSSQRLQRMLLSLQRYDLDITYRTREQQVIADSLSRFLDEIPNTEELSHQEVFQMALIQDEARELDVMRNRSLRSKAGRGEENCSNR